ncbi:ROK family protein [Leuconostoc gasicomitatum]|uniref:ROK family protein n=1 Tax=Leuconostoc gasicomitatum TaxID=115778 RepID=UPI0007E15517|nr:ROK family protein [Leuconostoc gasicomitatum]MBR2277030.1 ROK family protein [Leuconostoc sp.]MBZ5944383.1 ROK family protein [Leuconostoc gasicomitatum]MBZ5945219.1 ROK family protein [Leuconostoc gasicomitatum]MBZ5947020.1 ROK family protein [Leuconostoc gasicomitatum]MBZ5950408.1 ROK family protein [Leuconostoc gasicomitatum]
MGLLGAIEAGGTKFVVAVADENYNVVERTAFPTLDGEKTLDQVIAFFDKFENIDAIGIAAFGPIDIVKGSQTYGYVLDTPKRGWSGYDFLGRMKAWRDIPFFWTTDVNGAGWAEFETGAAKDVQNMVYLTVGTGIGAGIVSNGHLLSGYGHPEAGHIFLQKHPEDKYAGHCPFHGDNCLEGLAAGPAIEERWGISAKEIPDEDIAWKIEAYYIAQAALDYTMILRPEKIILGGGVPHRDILFPLIRESFSEQMSDYLEVPDLDDYIVPVANGDNAGILGCFYLAKTLL